MKVITRSLLHVNLKLILSIITIGLISVVLSKNVSAAAYEIPRSNYYDLPDNWNMPSCEKVFLGTGKDVLSTALPIFRCEGGKSAGNKTLPCNKDWTAAYAETAEVVDFPLMQFLSSISPQGTKDNNVQPQCYYDITNNSTREKGNYIVANFSNDYPGLLKLKGANKSADISFPRLGTATNCGVVDGGNYLHELRLDTQLFNQDMPQIPDKIADEGGDDFFSWIFNLIKSLSIFEEAIKSKEPTNIKTVKETLAAEGIDKPSVCDSNVGKPVVKINVSDKITPTPEVAQFVINKKQEIMNFTTTEMCDLDFISGIVIDAHCVFDAAGEFNNPGGTVGQGDIGLIVTEWSTPPFTIPPTPSIPIKCAVPACNWEGGCFPSQSEVYKACRGALGDVSSAHGDPKYLLSLNGFDTLSIQGANMTLSNTVNILEQINGPYDINYGENVGIKLDVQRRLFNLNSTTKEYDPNMSEGPDYEPTNVLTPLRDFISYKKTPYNYNYKKSFPFAKVDENKSQFYFPYIGKLPYLMERIAIIHSNTLDNETSYTMTQKYLNVAGLQSGGTENSDVLGTSVSGEVYKPQLKLCKDLTEEEKKVQDCYGLRSNDSTETYLCKFDLGVSCTECITDGGSTPGGNCKTLGSIMGKVAWPTTPGTGISNTASDHVGTDLGAGEGAPVYAIAEGEVVFVRDGLTYNCVGDCSFYNDPPYTTIDENNGWWGGYGNVVGIKYADGITTFGHLKVDSITVKVGDCVTQGQQVAEADNTGNSEGNHLHFEIRKLNCIDYTQSCVVNINTVDSLDESLNKPGSGGTPGGGTGSGGSGQCPATGPGQPASSYNCLIYNTAMYINQSGWLVSPEAIFAILSGEATCGVDSAEPCDGDANRISAMRPGGSFAPLPYTLKLSYPGDDGIGITQAVSWRMFKDIPKYVSEGDMMDCMSGIGVDVGNTDAKIKDPATSSNITRLRVGDSLCYLGLLMKSYNSGIGFSESDRTNLEKFGKFGYYYNQSSNYLRYLPYFSQAVDGKIFDSCETQ